MSTTSVRRIAPLMSAARWLAFVLAALVAVVVLSGRLGTPAPVASSATNAAAAYQQASPHDPGPAFLAERASVGRTLLAPPVVGFLAAAIAAVIGLLILDVTDRRIPPRPAYAATARRVRAPHRADRHSSSLTEAMRGTARAAFDPIA